MFENLQKQLMDTLKAQAKIQLRQYLRSKTVVYGLAICLLSLLQSFVVVLPINPVVQGLIGFCIGIGIIVLRVMTYLPLSKK